MKILLVLATMFEISNIISAQECEPYNRCAETKDCCGLLKCRHDGICVMEEELKCSALGGACRGERKCCGDLNCRNWVCMDGDIFKNEKDSCGVFDLQKCRPGLKCIEGTCQSTGVKKPKSKDIEREPEDSCQQLGGECEKSGSCCEPLVCSQEKYMKDSKYTKDGDKGTCDVNALCSTHNRHCTSKTQQIKEGTCCSGLECSNLVPYGDIFRGKCKPATACLHSKSPAKLKCGKDKPCCRNYKCGKDGKCAVNISCLQLREKCGGTIIGRKCCDDLICQNDQCIPKKNPEETPEAATRAPEIKITTKPKNCIAQLHTCHKLPTAKCCEPFKCVFGEKWKKYRIAEGICQ